jgi:hypothetical protein
LSHIVQAASGKADVMRVLFGAGDNSRFTVSVRPTTGGIGIAGCAQPRLSA